MNKFILVILSLASVLQAIVPSSAMDVEQLEKIEELHDELIKQDVHALKYFDHGHQLSLVQNDTSHGRGDKFKPEYCDGSKYDQCKFMQLEQYFGCHKYTNRPIPDQEQWRKMRQIYHDTVGPEESSIGHPTETFDGFAVPYSIAHFPGKGRGIVAKANISKRTLVWSGLRVATFRDGQKFRRYVLLLAKLQVELACDALMWSEVLPIDGELRICVNLDAGALCNDGEANIIEDHNLASKLPPVAGPAEAHMFAAHDIKAGAELLCDYSSYIVDDGWRHFGL